MPRKIKHVVGFKKQLMAGGLVYGYDFSRLVNCCDDFKKAFTIFQSNIYDNTDGISLLQRGELKVTSRFKNSELEIKFCPFCGVEVAVKETEVVELKVRKKEVDDGFDEILIRKNKI